MQRSTGHKEVIHTLCHLHRKGTHTNTTYSLTQTFYFNSPPFLDFGESPQQKQTENKKKGSDLFVHVDLLCVLHTKNQTAFQMKCFGFLDILLFKHY